MKAGIIAAGVGERLARKGISKPKPLVPLRGEPMIARVIHMAARLNVSSVACIVNAIDPSVSGYLQSRSWPVPLELVVKTTPNSMESLFSLAPLLDKDPFVLFTVDAVFPFETLKSFFEKACAINEADGVLALTDFIDDEKPLLARTDTSQRIIALGEKAEQSPSATAGFYFFRPAIFRAMDAARAANLGSLRKFLSLLIERNSPIYGLPVGKTVDVDCPEDLEVAESYLKEIEEGFRT